MVNYILMAGAHEKYFAFDTIKDRLHTIEDFILFAIICFLVYIWVKLFLYWDK